MAKYSGNFAKWVEKGYRVDQHTFQSMLQEAGNHISAEKTIHTFSTNVDLFPQQRSSIPLDDLKKTGDQNPLEEKANKHEIKPFLEAAKQYQLAAWHKACDKLKEGSDDSIATKLAQYKLEMRLLQEADTSGRLRYAPNPYMARAVRLAELEERAKAADADLEKFKAQVKSIGDFDYSDKERPGAGRTGLEIFGNTAKLDKYKNQPLLPDNAIEIIIDAHEKHKNETNPDSPKTALEDLKNRLEKLSSDIKALQTKANNTKNPSDKVKLEEKAQELQYQLSEINQQLNSTHTRQILQRTFQTKDENEKLMAFMIAMQHLQHQIPESEARRTIDPLSQKAVKPVELDVNLYHNNPASLLSDEETKYGHGISYYKRDQRGGYEKVALVDKDGNAIRLTAAQLDEAARLAEIEIKDTMKKAGKSQQEVDAYQITYSPKNWFRKRGTYHTESAENAEVLIRCMQKIALTAKNQDSPTQVAYAEPEQNQAAIVQQHQTPNIADATGDATTNSATNSSDTSPSSPTNP